jgi:hypothetical protein
MKLRVNRLSEGPGPGEVVIEVTTDQGVEQVIVHKASIVGDMIDIGFPIHRAEDQALIELPRESMSGRWRVWVPSSSVA